jgi:hypothetical protein
VICFRFKIEEKKIAMNINHYVEEFTNLWNSSSVSFPNLGEEIPFSEKLKREEGVEHFAKTMRNEVDLKNVNGSGKKVLVQQMKQNMGVFFKNSFNFKADELSILSEKGFTKVTHEFMKMARQFDPEVKMEDIFQASRNMWIINSLQIMMNEPVKVTPSTFAYSMLYPYTDNYLDNPSVSHSEKISFSTRFGKRLNGEAVLAANDHENTIFELVGMVEYDWDRVQYPKVYDSLLAIHNAQTRSIHLLNKNEQLSNDELLSICIEKGGTSVLADGYLIKGKLAKEEEWFCFGFGTFLQFVDDIQDIQEDMDGKLETLFTRATYTGKLEEFTNRSISFSNNVLDNMGYFTSDVLIPMKGLMNKSINFMVNEAVGMNNSCFSSGYVSEFEKYSPFRYSFVKKRRGNLEPNRISLMKKIEMFVFDEDKVAIEVS